MAELQKGLIQRADLDVYDGTLTTTRTSSTGGTTSGLKIGNAVDVLSVFGSGDTSNQTRATIVDATNALGSTNIGLEFAPGTWTIDDDLTIASNFTLVVPAGCVFSVSAGKTLTIQGVLFRQHSTYTAGSGTVTVSGTDILSTTGIGQYYAVDTGSADAYVIDPDSSPSSYSAGDMYRFKAANTNTGASTLNVNSLGTKSITQNDGSTALAAGEIVAGGIYEVIYESSNDVFHLQNTSDIFTDVFTTRGDMLYEGASGEARLAVGTAGQVIVSDGTDPTWGSPVTTGTVQAATSGSSKSFTIPSWAVRVTVNIQAFSTNGTVVPVVQIGDSGGLETSGYTGSISKVTGSPATGLLSSGFALAESWAGTSVWHGRVILELMDASNFLWSGTIVGGFSDAAGSLVGGGSKSLSAALTTVALVTSDTMDSGSVNVLYE